MQYRNGLPQSRGNWFITDGGIETTLLFHEGYELPHNVAFHLLNNMGAQDAMRRYFRKYLDLARRFGAGLLLESVTWRASADWGAKLGYSREELAQANRKAIRLLEEIAYEAEAIGIPAVISGCVGPRGDGYRPENLMTVAEAEAYHYDQIGTFAQTAADMVCGITINYTEEAIGIVRAAKRAEMPVAVSFTVETDGNLPTGETLESAIERVDAATSSHAAYFMINCAHPTHFEHVLRQGEPWLGRIGGLRANASRLSHAELDERTELDTGHPAELGRDYARLKARLPNLAVTGGCCGTDERHIEQIALACSPLFRAGSAAA